MIDRSGTWWTGTEAVDVVEYLREYTADGYPADRFEQARCVCGGTTFRLDADADEGCACRTCVACGAGHFVCDSAEFEPDSELEQVTCACAGIGFELVVGFSHFEDRSIRWISVGARCVRCGVLGCPVEWSIDDAPAEHLYAAV